MVKDGAGGLCLSFARGDGVPACAGGPHPGVGHDARRDPAGILACADGLHSLLAYG